MPKPRIDPAVVAWWTDLAARLTAADHGTAGRLVAEAAAGLGISKNTVYERLRTYGGWESGRRRRADAGTSRVDPDALHLVAALQRESSRANGKRLMSIDTAISIAEANGHRIPVTASEVARQLRRHRLDAGGQRAADTVTTMRSLHPNHVHQVDPSLCVLFYMRGKQAMMRESEFYKNKLDKYAQVKNKVWRYVRTDHWSGLIDLWYVEAPGESAANLGEFLIRTWSRRPDITGHGAPRVLLWDAGSANTSAPIAGLLDALDVRGIAHGAERPQVKGQVEQANNLIECRFEARLRVEPVADIDALNTAAQTWAELHNRNLIPRMDTRLRRPGIAPIARADLWLRISAEQLREIPAPEICRRFLEGRRRSIKVSQKLALTYRHPAADHQEVYDLRGCTGVHPGDIVEVAPLIIPEAGEAYPIRIHWQSPAGERQTWRVGADIERDAAGMPISAPIIGETYRALPTTDAARAADALDRIAYPVATADTGKGRTVAERARAARQQQARPFAPADGAGLTAHSHLAGIDAPAVLPRRGQAIDTPAVAATATPAPRVPLLRALLRLADAHGRDLTDAEVASLTARWPDGIPEDDLARLTAAGPDDVAPPIPVAPRLAVVR